MYRTLDTSFWADPKIKILPPYAKLLILYMITNDHTHMSGIYHLPMVLIPYETGLPQKIIDEHLAILADRHLVFYDMATETAWVVNMLRHQTFQKPLGEKITISVKDQLMTLHKSYLIKDFLSYYASLEIPSLSPFDTHSIGSPDPIGSHAIGSGDPPISISNPNSNPNSIPNPNPHLPFAEITEKPKRPAGIYGRWERFPADWQASPDMVATFQTRFPSLDISLEEEKLRDWEFKAPKTDPAATWRNWMRTAATQQHQSNGRPSPPSLNTKTQRNIDAAKRVMEKYGHGDQPAT